MHDLDRAMFETGEAGESEHHEQQEFLEVLGGLLREHEHGHETSVGHEVVDRATHEAQLAAELLEAHETGETEQFIGSLLTRAGGVARDFARSDTGRALGGILADAAGKALPVIGRGIGGAFGSQYAGLGERIGSGAKSALGLELEGLSQEDREFECAKAFIRFANSAIRRAAQAPPGAPPQAVARAAAATAAQQHAPGLLAAASPAARSAGAARSTGAGAAPSTGADAVPSTGAGAARGRAANGQWVRRGDHIVVLGA
jgi:hypothetical protein